MFSGQRERCVSPARLSDSSPFWIPLLWSGLYGQDVVVSLAARSSDRLRRTLIAAGWS
jgi:hypothetical protein